jgi:hypothetical protein
MSANLTTTAGTGELERLLIGGDLSVLNEPQRVEYYARVCESLRLNPLTKPFEYLRLSGKLVLYARKDCTDQLRKLHGVSVLELSESEREGVYIVTAKVRDAHGRTDVAKGAVPIKGLAGDALANAVMKAECVPLDSEILTRDGFKTHDCLKVGDEVLAYDCGRDVTEWVPLESVTVYPTAAVEALHTEKGQFRVVCTADHSWAVQKEAYKPDTRGSGERGPRGPYCNRGPDRLLVKAHEINTRHRLILSAPCVDAGPSLLAPIEAAVLGWAVTDGTIKRVGNSVRIGICQSKDRHKPAIRRLVQAAAAGPVREFISPARDRTFPMSGKTYRTRPQHWWYLPAAVSRDLLTRAGYRSRADLPRIAARLNGPAREAMLGAMMAAEGDDRGMFANTDRHIMEAFQVLCALQGLATGGLRTIKGGCFTQRRKKTRHVAGNFLRIEAIGECAVWCPTTKHGTWVMRQNGQVTITGNTKAKRRATLSVCGLGMLDETEIETVPMAERILEPPALPASPDADAPHHESEVCSREELKAIAEAATKDGGTVGGLCKGLGIERLDDLPRWRKEEAYRLIADRKRRVEKARQKAGT